MSLVAWLGGVYGSGHHSHGWEVVISHHVVEVGMAGSHVCVCAPVKPTRGYYVTTRGCATDYVCVTPSIPHFIVGLSLLSCVLDQLSKAHTRKGFSNSCRFRHFPADPGNPS